MLTHYLYIEDDELNCEVMKTIIEVIMEAKITLFMDTTNFMQRLLALDPQPDVILVDLHIVPYDGYEVLEMIRAHEQTSHYKVIVVTASVLANIIEKLKTSGFNGALTKPIDIRKFPLIMERVEASEEIWQGD